MRFDITLEKVLVAALIAVMIASTTYGLYLMVVLLRTGHVGRL